jgi:hypothetical protein
MAKSNCLLVLAFAAAGLIAVSAVGNLVWRGYDRRTAPTVDEDLEIDSTDASPGRGVPFSVEIRYPRPENGWRLPGGRDQAVAGLANLSAPRFAGPPDTADVLHALRLWGATAGFGDGEWTGHEMWRFLSDHEFFRTSLGDEYRKALLVPTDLGVMVRVSGKDETATAHRDSLLSAAASAGLPLDTVMHTTEGSATLRDVLRRSIAVFSLEGGEIDWTAQAYALYFPEGQTSWVNRFGQSHSFDDLAEHLMSLPRGEGTCYGTHHLYALAVILNVHDRVSRVSDSAATAVREYLRRTSEHLTKYQHPEGSWGGGWEEEKRPELVQPMKTLGGRLRATGHHLEWIALVPRELGPDEPVVQKALSFLCSSAHVWKDFQPDKTLV